MYKYIYMYIYICISTYLYIPAYICFIETLLEPSSIKDLTTSDVAKRVCSRHPTSSERKRAIESDICIYVYIHIFVDIYIYIYIYIDIYEYMYGDREREREREKDPTTSDVTKRVCSQHPTPSERVREGWGGREREEERG